MLILPVQPNLHAGNSVEGVGIVQVIRVEVRPEFDEEERVAGSLLVQLLEAAFLLWELVIYLLHVYRLLGINRNVHFTQGPIIVVSNLYLQLTFFNLGSKYLF